MPEDSNETANIDEILAELKNETVEEKPFPKKVDKPKWADKKNTETETYEYSEDKDLSDDEW